MRLLVGQLFPLAGLICLVTVLTSATPTSSISADDTLASKLLSGTILYPLKGNTGDFYSFSETLNNVTVINSVSKRKADSQYFWAFETQERDVWRITATKEARMNYRKVVEEGRKIFWTGTLKGNGVKLGSGGQGNVTKGRWLEYKSRPKASLKGKIPTHDNIKDDQPVAVKVSKGWKGYEVAQNLQQINSPDIVKSYVYAYDRVNGISVVAFERLDETAQALWKAGKRVTDVVPVVAKAVRRAAAYGWYNLDLKLANIMIEDRSQLECAVWKIIDWDMMVRGGFLRGHIGTVGYMSPEMTRNYVRKRKHEFGDDLSWDVNKASAWTMGMIALYVCLGEYEGTPNLKMINFAKLIKRRKLADHDPVWWWIAMMVKYSEDGKIDLASIFPAEIAERLPDERYPILQFLKMTLCEENVRITVEEAADYLLD